MDYIEIKGYKSIKSQKIPLNPINILIGANGSGKSNFISFFEFLNRLYERKLNEYVALSGGANKFLHKGQSITDIIFFKISFDSNEENYSSQLVLISDANQFIFNFESLLYSDENIALESYGKESRLKVIDHYEAKNIIKHLNGFRKYHFHYTNDKSPFTKLCHIENDINYLYSDGSNLAAILFSIQQNDKVIYSRIIKTIQSIAPYFSDFYFAPNKENYIRFLWKDKYSDMTFGATDLSDGTIRFVALTVLFMQPELPDTIIIDEPELGLHPFAISKLSGMIKSAAAKGCQVILATQSTDLISHFSPKDIITVDQINGESIFNRLKEEELNHWLEEYTLDDLWKRNIISSGQPNH